jgi:hypothetical protein
VDHGKLAQSEIALRATHGGSNRWGRRPLEFEPETILPAHNKQIEFGALVGGPKEAFTRLRPQVLDQLTQGEPFPRSTDLWMAEQIEVTANPKQDVE